MPRARLEVGRSAADTSLKQRVAAADDHTMQLSCGKCWLNRCASHTMPPPGSVKSQSAVRCCGRPHGSHNWRRLPREGRCR